VGTELKKSRTGQAKARKRKVEALEDRAGRRDRPKLEKGR